MRSSKLTVISNVTLAHAWPRGNALEPVFVPYEAYESDTPKDADLVAVILNYDALYPNFIVDTLRAESEDQAAWEDYRARCRRLYDFLRRNTHAAILWFGAEDFCYHPYTHTVGHVALTNGRIDAVNTSIAQMLSENGAYIDLKLLIAEVGIPNAYDLRGKHRWNAPYSRALLGAMAAAVEKQARLLRGDTKKCLVLDCDNVLWGGVLSEDGVENIRLDPSHLDLQRYLLSLYHRGVILTVCSKNDREDVLQAFRAREDMLLQERHIACFCVNWRDKPDNIRTVANALNIGLDSMVFLDDSSFEVEAVRATLPQVTAVRYDRDTVYGNLSCFTLPPCADGEKVRLRTETYQTNERREQLRQKTATYEEYLVSLQMKLTFREATDTELSRLSELTRRTNKCTNGTRYTAEELRRKRENGYRLYAITLSDRFSDLGIVGAVGLQGTVLDLFSLSCRALGRGLEREMLVRAQTEGARSARFTPTQKNGGLYDLLAEFFDSAKENKQ